MESKQGGQAGTSDKAHEGKVRLDPEVVRERITRLMPRIAECASTTKAATPFRRELTAAEFAIAVADIVSSELTRFRRDAIKSSGPSAPFTRVNTCDATSLLLVIATEMLDGLAALDAEVDDKGIVCKCLDGKQSVIEPSPQSRVEAALRDLFPGIHVVSLADLLGPPKS